MTISDKPLVVKNIEQKLLFLLEMQGQISDGKWENDSNDHWEVWSNLDWNSVGIGDNIGRKFFAKRDGYNFTNKDLIETVGSRMLFYVNFYKKFTEKTEKILAKGHSIPDDYNEAKNIFDGTYIQDINNPKDYFAKKMHDFIDAGFTLADFKEVEDNKEFWQYTEKDMMADLRGLKKAFKPEGTFQLNDYGKFLRAVIPPTNYLPRLEELKAMIEKNNF